MATFTIYNNNDSFGDRGPFEIEADTFEVACRKLADEMKPSFEMWALEELEAEAEEVGDALGGSAGLVGDEECAIESSVDSMRREFIKGLTEVK